MWVMKRLALCWLLAISTALSQEPLTVETVVANRDLWPREVTVAVAHEVPLVVNGKPSGSLKVQPGRTYPLKSLTTSEVTVDALGVPLVFAPADTDVLARAEKQKERLDTLAAAPTPVPAPSPVAARTSPTPVPVTNATAALLKDRLVTCNGRKFEDFDAAQLAGKKYLAVYFSASWCGPCRRFTPELVRMYKRKKSARDKFDIIFVSADRSEEAMLEYMKEEKMDWPAIAYDKLRGHPLARYGGGGIPCLVLLDENGNVVSHSYEGGTYVGPTKVMKDLEKLLKDS
jgi:Thiol-disulfide isomerase and thioredoxins